MALTPLIFRPSTQALKIAEGAGGPPSAAEGGVTAGAGAMSVMAESETATAAGGAAAKTIDGLSGVTRSATGGSESG